jgi:DNA polymerase
MYIPANFPEEYIEEQTAKLEGMDLPGPIEALRCEVQKCTTCPKMVESRQRYYFGKPTFGYGNWKSRLFVIAQSPGYKGCGTTGMPFEPRSRTGEIYELILTNAGLTFEDVWTSNLVKCCPQSSFPPTAKAIRECAKYLLREISLINPTHILSVGSYARHFVEKHRLWKKYKTHSIYHPGYILRKMSTYDDYIRDTTRLFRQLSGGLVY